MKLMDVLLVVALAMTPALTNAQKPVTQGASVSETFTIDAIDYKARMVTLRDAKGQTETIFCGPDVQRFDALKVGDRVTFRYYESVVYAIRKPGSGPAASASADMVRTPGDRPGGTISQQMTAMVTIAAIDPKVPSVTITTKDGQKMSSRVENPKNLEGLKVGDQVEVTYTQALAINVTPAK